MSVNKLLTRAEHFLDSYLNKTQRIIFGVKYEEMCGDYPDQYRVCIEKSCSSTFNRIFIDEIKHDDDEDAGTIKVYGQDNEVFFLCTADKRSCILAVPYSERDDRLYHCYDCISDETVLITFIEKIKGGDIKFFVNDNAPNNNSFEINENRDSSVIRFSKTIKFRLEN